MTSQSVPFKDAVWCKNEFTNVSIASMKSDKEVVFKVSRSNKQEEFLFHSCEKVSNLKGLQRIAFDRWKFEVVACYQRRRDASTVIRTCFMHRDQWFPAGMSRKEVVRQPQSGLTHPPTPVQELLFSPNTSANVKNIQRK